MQKKVLIEITFIVVLIALTIGIIAWTSINPAKTEAQSVLKELRNDTSNQWYCENGAGKGIDNQTPWWEEIYLSDAETGLVSSKVEGYLATAGYITTKKFIENSQDSYNQGKTYWEIDGTRNSYSVKVRVSSKILTLNNCFEGFSNMNNPLRPENNNSVIVIQFKDNS